MAATATALFETIAVTFPGWGHRYDTRLGRARRAVGPDPGATRLAEGRVLPLDQAVASALAPEAPVSQAMPAHWASQRTLDALRGQAVLTPRQKRWAEAEQALARSMPFNPYAETRLLHVYGHTHAAKGEPGPARERLEAALATIRRLGARKDMERVDADIAKLQQP